MTKPSSVCVIGAGPGGMFFLHALASRRRKLEKELASFAANKNDGHGHNAAAAAAAARAECEAKLAVLPVVDCYEKSSSPGGVWRSASASSAPPAEILPPSINNTEEHEDEPASPDTSLCSNESDEENQNQANASSNDRNMAVRCSGVLGDGTFKATAKVAANKPSSSILSSTAAEAADNVSASTQMYEALWINGNKEVQEFFDYTFDEHFQRPMPVYLPRAHVLEYVLSRVTQKANIFDNVLFNTSVVSVEYNSERKEFDVISRNEITGVTSSKTYDKCIWSGGLNATAKMPRDLVAMLSHQNFSGRVIHSTEMKDFEATVRGKRVLFVGDSYSAEDLALQSIKLGAEQIYITSGESSGMASYANAWPGDRAKVLWYMLPTGVTADGRGIILSSVEWNYSTERYEPTEGGEIDKLEDISTVVMCTGYSPNFDILSDELKAPELSGGEYYVEEGLYRRALIANPNMMFLFESSLFPLLEIDVAAWLCLAYVCGDVDLPTADEMKKLNSLEDAEYDVFLQGSEEDEDLIRYQIQIIARDMEAAGYPAGFVSYEKLSERGERMVKMEYETWQMRYRLKSGDPDSSWRTFRDGDPSPFKSIYTGTGSVPLKGKWMDLDHRGEVST